MSSYTQTLNENIREFVLNNERLVEKEPKREYGEDPGGQFPIRCLSVPEYPGCVQLHFSYSVANLNSLHPNEKLLALP